MADATPIDQLTEQILTAVRGYVDSRLQDAASAISAADRAQAAADAVAKSIDALSVVAAGLKPGRDGVDGRNGVDGKDGASVDPDVVRRMVESAVSMIPAPKDGRDGIDGKSVDPEVIRSMVDAAVSKIPAPRDGRDGESINPAAIKSMVEAEVARLPVAKDGKDGKDGAHGRDALQIEILDSLDQDKSYPRGTYAKHNGGLVRAYRDTDPFNGAEVERCGWQVLINPVVGIELKQDDANPKRMVFVTSKAFGKSAEMALTIPVMVYRGVFREGDDYTEGDTVTWAGSVWHCKSPMTSAKPGDGSPDWSLAVKRGRDGRDGKDGLNGKDGKVIRS